MDSKDFYNLPMPILRAMVREIDSHIIHVRDLYEYTYHGDRYITKNKGSETEPYERIDSALLCADELLSDWSESYKEDKRWLMADVCYYCLFLGIDY